MRLGLANMEVVRLDRFRLEGFLGSGSDYEAHAATDSHTGKQVVIKRPNPDYITRGLHHSVDQLSEHLIEVHRNIEDSVPYIAHLVGYTEVAEHDGYFEDSLKESYRVLVEERARGLPLVSDIRDKFKGIPVGLGQNLFALHPLVPEPANGYFAVQRQIMDVEEAFHKAGHLLLDMRPQNIYFDPSDSQITVIDIGTIPTGGPASQGRASVRGQTRDVHDFFGEMFQYYMTPTTPPVNVAGYKEPAGMKTIPDFNQLLDIMIRSFSEVPDPVLREAAISTLQKVQKRSYSSFGDFRRDFTECLHLTQQRNNHLPDIGDLLKVWVQALDMLSDAYWRKFLFDPGSDLEHYRTT